MDGREESQAARAAADDLIRAAASKHRAMSHGRMLEEEARLKAEVEALLSRSDEVDRREDEEHGEGRDAVDVPAELARRETRLASPHPGSS